MVIQGETAEIVVVEDDNSLRAVIVAAIHDALGDIEIAEAADVDEAMALLFDNPDAFPPSLVLLDLNFPGGGVGAMDLLERIRGGSRSGALTATPVVIFSDSRLAEDVAECYRLGANSYIRKPMGHFEFQNTVGDLARYWIGTNLSPV